MLLPQRPERSAACKLVREDPTARNVQFPGNAEAAASRGQGLRTILKAIIRGHKRCRGLWLDRF